MFLTSIFLCLLTVVAAAPGSYPTPSAPPPQNKFLQNYQQKWSWFIRFADAFMYPNNTAQAQTINSTLFSENIQGRVDLTSTFDGRELNTEVLTPHTPKADRQYIFGLFSTIATESGNPDIFNLLGVPINYTVTGFTVTGPQVVASFIFWVLYPGNISLPVEVILFLQFNDQGEITEVHSFSRVVLMVV